MTGLGAERTLNDSDAQDDPSRRLTNRDALGPPPRKHSHRLEERAPSAGRPTLIVVLLKRAP